MRGCVALSAPPPVRASPPPTRPTGFWRTSRSSIGRWRQDGARLERAPESQPCIRRNGRRNSGAARATSRGHGLSTRPLCRATTKPTTTGVTSSAPSAGSVLGQRQREQPRDRRGRAACRQDRPQPSSEPPVLRYTTTCIHAALKTRTVTIKTAEATRDQAIAGMYNRAPCDLPRLDATKCRHKLVTASIRAVAGPSSTISSAKIGRKRIQLGMSNLVPKTLGIKWA